MMRSLAVIYVLDAVLVKDTAGAYVAVLVEDTAGACVAVLVKDAVPLVHVLLLS